jgi:hypothetical protein
MVRLLGNSRADHRAGLRRRWVAGGGRQERAVAPGCDPSAALVRLLASDEFDAARQRAEDFHRAGDGAGDFGIDVTTRYAVLLPALQKIDGSCVIDGEHLATVVRPHDARARTTLTIPRWANLPTTPGPRFVRSKELSAIPSCHRLASRISGACNCTQGMSALRNVANFSGRDNARRLCGR